MRDLTTCEDNGTHIQHACGTNAIIIGSYYEGFIIRCTDEGDEGQRQLLFDKLNYNGGWKTMEY